MVEEVLGLLADLANKGVKLSVEGNDLKCYAPAGALTKEVRERILRAKPEIIDRLRDYIDFQKLAPTNSKSKAQAGELAGVKTKHNLLTEPPLDLAAEA